jgi:hypothetical protein
MWAVSGTIEVWYKERIKLIHEVSDLPEAERGQGGVGSGLHFGLCVLSLIAGAITIFGGIRMLSLKSYSLAILASALAAIPFISLMGCFGIGQGVGIWSLVVLMSADVRTAFR